MTGLPVFPTDDSTLTQLEHALNTSIDITDDGERRCVGGEFTVSMLLDFLSGYDPERATLTGYADFGLGELPVYEAWDTHYSEHDVIRALVARVRALETGA